MRHSMPGGTRGNQGERRRGRSGWTHVPAECAGFVSAVRAAIGGDEAPLRQWHRDARPRLERSLIRAGLDAALADDAAARLIEEAFVCVSTDRPPSNELAWAASVIRTARSRRIRERARWAPLEGPERASTGCDPASLADRAETIRRVRAAIADLPSPWRDALELHCLREWCVEDVAAYLHAWRGVGVERTRKILATGRQMLAARLCR